MPSAKSARGWPSSLDDFVFEGRNRERTLAAVFLRNEDLAGAGLKAELSGVPVMQLDIRNAVERDRLVYNTIGFFAGCLIAILFSAAFPS
jgi:uncharacterized protein